MAPQDWKMKVASPEKRQSRATGYAGAGCLWTTLRVRTMISAWSAALMLQHPSMGQKAMQKDPSLLLPVLKHKPLETVPATSTNIWYLAIYDCFQYLYCKRLTLWHPSLLQSGFVLQFTCHLLAFAYAQHRNTALRSSSAVYSWWQPRAEDSLVS